MTSLWQRLADLRLHVGSLQLEPLSVRTSAGWTRRTTVVRLGGADDPDSGDAGGLVGEGEDVTYDADEQEAFQREGRSLAVAGSWTLASFSEHLDTLPLWPRTPCDPAAHDYRRWAFESAALDLALQEAGLTLGEALGVTAFGAAEDPGAPQRVRFVLSQGLASPGARERFEALLLTRPDTRFKLDYDADWTPDLVARLAATGRVDVVDLKGHYRLEEFQGPPADAAQYRMVAEGLPDAWIEDPAWDAETADALDPVRERVTWDSPLHSLADVQALPFPPCCINVKPSRFGTVSELCAVLDHCRAEGIRSYSGGQFELGVGRRQIQRLAALWHPDAPNDVAPAGYHAEEPRADLPQAVLALSAGVTGFR